MPNREPVIHKRGQPSGMWVGFYWPACRGTNCEHSVVAEHECPTPCQLCVYIGTGKAFWVCDECLKMPGMIDGVHPVYLPIAKDRRSGDRRRG